MKKSKLKNLIRESIKDLKENLEVQEAETHYHKYHKKYFPRGPMCVCPTNYAIGPGASGIRVFADDCGGPSCTCCDNANHPVWGVDDPKYRPTSQEVPVVRMREVKNIIKKTLKQLTEAKGDVFDNIGNGGGGGGGGGTGPIKIPVDQRPFGRAINPNMELGNAMDMDMDMGMETGGCTQQDCGGGRYCVGNPGYCDCCKYMGNPEDKRLASSLYSNTGKPSYHYMIPLDSEGGPLPGGPEPKNPRPGLYGHMGTLQ